MKRYLYAGPLSTLPLEDGKSVPLFPGSELELPDEPRVSALVERGLLTEVAGTVQRREAGPQSSTIQSTSDAKPARGKHNESAE